jgi:hypothetical protein
MEEEAYKAWKKAEANTMSPQETFRILMGFGRAAPAPAGPEDSCDGGSSDDADSDGGGNTMPQACRQQ